MQPISYRLPRSKPESAENGFFPCFLWVAKIFGQKAAYVISILCPYSELRMAAKAIIADREVAWCWLCFCTAHAAAFLVRDASEKHLSSALRYFFFLL